MSEVIINFSEEPGPKKSLLIRFKQIFKNIRYINRHSLRYFISKIWQKILIGLKRINPILWFPKAIFVFKTGIINILRTNYKQKFFNIFKFASDKNYRNTILKLVRASGHNLLPVYAENQPARDYAWKSLGWTKHLGIFSLVAIIWIAGAVSNHQTQNIVSDELVPTSLLDTRAVTMQEVETSIKQISKFTPLARGNAKLVAARIVGEDTYKMTEESFLIKPTIIETGEEPSKSAIKLADSKEQGLIEPYTVQEGDTIGKIASNFGISVDAIKDSNGLDSDIIKPGQTLNIPTSDGMIYTVARGDTLIAIVSKLKGNLSETISQNNLSGADRIYEGQKLVIIGGRKPAPTPSPTRLASASNSSNQKVAGSSTQAPARVYHSSGPNHFPYGWCTWYVASRRYVPWHGNAGAWARNAQAYGYAVGTVPVPGAIRVTQGGYFGHVSYVEAVYGNTITISEMNQRGWGIISSRTTSAGGALYIY